MITTAPVSSPVVVPDVPLPYLGGSQHLVLVRHSGSQRSPSPFLLEWNLLPRTVLASAFLPGVDVSLPVPLDGPLQSLVLPPLTREQLQPRLAKDADGRVLGMLLSLPGLYVHANSILTHSLQQNPRYNYRWSVAEMAVEAARLLAIAVRNGLLRVRERPGVMGHAVALGELAPDEIALSHEFASTLYRRNRQRLEGLAPNVWALDGFPCWGIRFPVASPFGIQPKVLRIVAGRGQFVGFNPWDLGKRYLGDQDGDLGFGILRVDDLLDGKAFIEKRPRLELESQITRIHNPLTLQNVLDPSLLPVEPKLQAKMQQVDLTSQEKRLGFIADCDTRTMVAVFTMAFAWWVPRVLATVGGLGVQEAYIKGHQALEWFCEQAMDGRKEGSPFRTPGFDAYQFMDTLMGGGQLDFPQLAQIGVPEHAIQTLALAWQVSAGNLRDTCATSPVYDALVLRRRQMNDAVIDMLHSLNKLGVAPADLYATIMNDLTALQPLFGNDRRSSGSGSADYYEEEDL